VTSSRPASADALANARAQAAQITSELSADQQHLDVVSQQYDAAQQQVQQLSAQMTQIRTTIAQDQTVVGEDQANLREDAVTSYMDGTTGGGIQTLFTANSEQASAADEYRSVVSGDISGAIDALDLAQSRLTTEQGHLQTAQNQAQSALTQVATARVEAQATVASQEATLNGMTAQIATLVAQRQAAQAAAAHAAFEARLAASTATPVHHGSSSPGRGATLADLPSASGAAGAVQSAESQIGVPYVWGGESPGRGFDCSGLTQWAWGRAGVSLPRTAAAQYAAIPHIPLSDLQPGDLVFWGYGGISHVGMYVGNGDVVDAPQTGEDVQIQPIWGNGLVGAGRP
jgi:cell wall-associated NlpC family hydrolase